MSQQMSFEQFAQQIQQLLASGQGEQALQTLQGVVRAQPDQPQLRHLLGAVYTTLGKTEQARAEFRRVLEQAPGQPRVLLDYAMSCRQDQLFDEAHEVIDQALASEPGNPQLVAFKAELFFLEACYDDAADYLGEQIDGNPQPHPGLLLLDGRLSLAADRLDRARESLERCLAVMSLPPQLRAEALFRLAQLQDAKGEYEQAFQTARKANDTRGVRLDMGIFTGLIDEMIKIWTRERLSALPRSEEADSDRAILLVGMPRSGMGLVEQILAGHPDIYGAGELGDIAMIARRLQGMFAFDPPLLTNMSELNAVNIKGASQAYLTRLRQLGGAALRVTDRMQLSFLQLGLVSLLAPEVGIIHVRRDPVDTCLSCYMHNFASSVPFAYSLEQLGRTYREYERLMAHWAEVLDLSICEVRYEDLVADIEGETTRLLGFAGLDWNEACLRSHETGVAALRAGSDHILRPVHDRSVNRRANYEAHLGELVAALNEEN